MDGRWKPGQSGNPKGRPKKKERSNTLRQMVSDFLNATEREVTITVDGKRKKMPFIEAILEQAAIKAAKGNYRFFAKIVEMRQQAIKLSAMLNPRVTQMLESIEQHLAEQTDENPPPPDFIDEINKLRRKTRKF